MQCRDNDPDNFIEVWVEIRMWRRSGCGPSLRPVAVPAVLVCDAAGDPVLTVEDNDGEALFYPAEETQSEGFGSVLVLFEPSPEQARTLAAAAEKGYPIEPRIAGKPFQVIEDL